MNLETISIFILVHLQKKLIINYFKQIEKLRFRKNWADERFPENMFNQAWQRIRKN